MSPERFQNIKFSEPSQMEAKIKKRALPSREEVFETLELRTHNNPVNSSLLKMYHEEMKSYVDHVLFLASGQTPENPAPHWSDPRLSYHYRIVRERVSGMPEKFSKGFKKGVRKRKAEVKRASR